MPFSQSEIQALVHIAGSDQPTSPRTLQEELGLRRETVSRLITRLVQKGLVERRRREVILADTPQAEAFKRLYYSHRATPLHKILSNHRIVLLCSLDQTPRSLEALALETGIPADTIYGYLNGFLRLGVASRSKQGKSYRYAFNLRLWPELKDCAAALQEYPVLRLVPRESLLIKSYKYSVLFKSIRPQNATITSFSAYRDYGIPLGLRDYYYTLPSRELSIDEVFIHSLDSAWEPCQKLFCILFYLKNNEMLDAVDHPMIEKIKKVLEGESVRDYPALQDIVERADLYDIKL